MSGKADKTTETIRQGEAPNRRDLLKGAALAGVGAAAALPLAVTGAVAAESPAEQVKARYQETEHVKRYYYLNRL